MSSSNTRVFLNYLMQDKAAQAKSCFDSATYELDSFRKRDKLTEPQKKTICEITKILEAVKNDQIKTAISRAKSVNSDFDKNIEPYLMDDAYKRTSGDQNSSQTQQHYGRHDDGQPTNVNHRSGYITQSHHGGHGQGQGNADNSQSNRDRRDVGQNNNYDMNGQNAGTYPDRPANRARIEPVNPEADLEYRSRMAGQRMRHNNPDIADLSDVNRPTKVAERFSELYDNEWTEAFEALVKSMKDEQKVIQLLLDIVETAYMFCKKEAEQQIDDMRQKILQILTGGMVKNPQTVPGSDTLLIQFRKSIANTAVDRVVQEFRARKLPEIFKAWGKGLPTKGGPVDLYTCKSVELTWWMCVQDPPIYMCMHDERIEPSTYPTLYKAYTRSGKIKDYSVWPALKLHQGGGVLVKGVMQFK